LALERDQQRRSFAQRVNSAIMPDAVPFTRQVVNKLGHATTTTTPTTRRVKKSTTSVRKPTTGRHAANRSTGRIQRRPAAANAALQFLSYAFAAGVAACIVITVMLRGDPTPAPLAVAPSPSTSAAVSTIATMANSESATWTTQPGPLTAGVRLHLARGLIELDLHGKGRLLLDGPADLELTSSTRVVLRNGRLVLNVTPEGHGYQVETPGGTFIDLGTRFGVSVAADGTTEAHVIEGSISARATNSSNEVVLGRDDAARLQSGRLERIPVDPGAFYTNLPPHGAKAAARIHWRMDEGLGVVARADVRDFEVANAELTLKGARGSTLPRWIEGRYGRALAFDGRGGYAESGFPGISGPQARTVTSWIRMPRDFTNKDGFAIVSWGHPLTTGRCEVWQISLNPLPNDGPVGRIRVGTHGGILVGTSDLRDDRWHHIAVVMFGGARPDIGTHVLVYVDGELEPISRRTLQTIDTRILDDGHSVWVGRNVTHVDETRTNPQGFLRGAVDDLSITAAALTQDEIRTLMNGR
jgi:hypothetical protein